MSNIPSIIQSLRSNGIGPTAYEEEKILSEELKDSEIFSNFSIKLLSIIGGILSTIAFLIFLGIAGLFSSEQGMLAIGLIMIVLSLIINSKYEHLLLDTASVATYLSGTGMFIFGLSIMSNDINSVSFTIICIGIVTLFVTQNYLLALIAFLMIQGGILTWLLSNNEQNMLHIFVSFMVIVTTSLYMAEAKSISNGNFFNKLYKPCQLATLLGLIISLIMIGLKKHFFSDMTYPYQWFSGMIIIGAILFLIRKILMVLQVAQITHLLGIYGLLGILLLPTFMSPAIAGALLILLLGTYINHRITVVLGVLMLTYAVIQYYYDLEITLLTKSILLFSSGITFLILYFLTTQKSIINEKH